MLATSPRLSRVLRTQGDQLRFILSAVTRAAHKRDCVISQQRGILAASIAVVARSATRQIHNSQPGGNRSAVSEGRFCGHKHVMVHFSAAEPAAMCGDNGLAAWLLGPMSLVRRGKLQLRTPAAGEEAYRARPGTGQPTRYQRALNCEKSALLSRCC